MQVEPIEGTARSIFSLNSRKAIPIESDDFVGSALILIKPKSPADDLYYSSRLFDGRDRKLELQVRPLPAGLSLLRSLPLPIRVDSLSLPHSLFPCLPRPFSLLPPSLPSSRPSSPSLAYLFSPSYLLSLSYPRPCSLSFSSRLSHFISLIPCHSLSLSASY